MSEISQGGLLKVIGALGDTINDLQALVTRLQDEIKQQNKVIDDLRPSMYPAAPEGD